MECPKCKVGKLKILISAHNPDENEAYKKRECLDCGNIFYTVEYEVIANEQFIDTFHKYFNEKYRERKVYQKEWCRRKKEHGKQAKND